MSSSGTDKGRPSIVDIVLAYQSKVALKWPKDCNHFKLGDIGNGEGGVGEGGRRQKSE